MNNRIMLKFKRHPILTSVAIGLFIFVVFSTIRNTPERTTTEGKYPAVRIIEVKQSPVTVTAIGYGNVVPTETWRAIANVAGHILEKNPKLESGEILPKGSLLLRLDPRRFELSVTDAKAEIASISTEISKLNAEQKDIQRRLEFEYQREKLSKSELERIQSLFDSGSVSQSILDQQRQLTLSHNQTVARLEGSLELIPIQLQTLNEKKKRAEVKLARAERDLKDTVFYAPYDIRINQSDVELHQFITQGQLLFSADNVASSDVEARFPIQEFKKVYEANITPNERLQDLRDLTFSGIKTELSLVGIENITWDAKLIRIANGLEPNTRSVRAVVQIENPYQNIKLPNRPAIQPNMYVRVKLSASSLHSYIAVPATIISNNQVLVLDEQNKVARRSVDVRYYQEGLAIISSGLKDGEKIIVDDIPFIANGATVETERDKDLEHRIARMSKGDLL